MFKDFTKYEVYSDGSIWSYKTKRFLKPKINKYGYKEVSLSDNECKIKTYRLNRVVWESVTGEPIPKGMQVNHINEDKTDNRFENLNLMTPKENINFGSRNAKVAKANTNNPKLSKQVGAFKDCELVMTFQSLGEAQRQGFYTSGIYACCIGKMKTYKGFEWKYL